jgi:uncharacterized protein
MPKTSSLTPDRLTPEERLQLLKLARQALEDGVYGRTPVSLYEDLTPRLRQNGVTFVTLTHKGVLRGCVGALEAYQPLADDVRIHALDAALHDYRFPPVCPEELSEISIGISCLTPPQPLIYDCPEELVMRLRPGVDGVVLQDGIRRATFLPQVWEKIPDPEIFLNLLCLKMGAPQNLWQRKKVSVYIYQVEEFHEE